MFSLVGGKIKCNAIYVMTKKSDIRGRGETYNVFTVHIQTRYKHDIKVKFIINVLRLLISEY